MSVRNMKDIVKSLEGILGPEVMVPYIAPTQELVKQIKHSQDAINAQLAQQLIVNEPSLEPYKIWHRNENTQTSAPRNLSIEARQMLLMRLEGLTPNKRWLDPKDHIYCYYIHESGEVAIFYVFGTNTGVVTDDVNLFPSDALITQLRLLRG